MKEFIKKNFVVMLAFALPIILIIVVALSSYLPSLFIKTDYDFVYTTCFDGRSYYTYNCESYLYKRYTVIDQKVTVHFVATTTFEDINRLQSGNENFSERIFLHDTEKNESREITLAEAESLTLNSLLTSPDGVTVSGHYNRNGGDFFLFSGGSSYGYYLTKGNSRSRLHLINNSDQYYYQNNFQFLGWVLPERNSL